MEKRPFFRAAMAGSRKYHTGGYGRIGVYRVNATIPKWSSQAFITGAVTSVSASTASMSLDTSCWYRSTIVFEHVLCPSQYSDCEGQLTNQDEHRGVISIAPIPVLDRHLKRNERGKIKHIEMNSCYLKKV